MNKLCTETETTPAVLENGTLLVDPAYCISWQEANCIWCRALPFCHMILPCQFLQLFRHRFYASVDFYKLFFQLEKKRIISIKTREKCPNTGSLNNLHSTFQWLKSSWLSRWNIILGFNLYTACLVQPKLAPKSEACTTKRSSILHYKEELDQRVPAEPLSHVYGNALLKEQELLEPYYDPSSLS